MASVVDTSKPVHLNVGGTIRTIIPNELINSQQEQETFFTKLFTQQVEPTFSPSNMFSDPIYFVNCECHQFNMIFNWLKYGMINKNLSEYEKLELINSCKEMQCVNLLKSLQNNDEAQVSAVKSGSSDDITFQIVKFGMLKVSLDLSKRNLKKFNWNGATSESKLLFSESCMSESSLNNCNLAADFSKCDLSGSSLVNSTFDNCDFSSSNLKTCNFSKSKLITCNFDNADLSDVNFEGTSFEGSYKFYKSNLSASKLNGATFTYNPNGYKYENSKVYFTGSFMSGSCLNNCNFIADFSKCDLSSSSLVDSTFNNSDFSSSNLKTCNLSKSHLSYCNLANADLSCGSSLVDSTFNNCDFSSNNLKSCNFSKSRFFNCKFDNADISCGSSLVDSTFDYCDFSSSNLKTCNFSKSKLITCNFDNADLSDVNFEGTSFEGGYKFYKSNLSAAKFNGATFTYNPKVYFTESFMSGSCLNNCNFIADFSKCDLSSSSLVDSTFNNSDFSSSNLKTCNLSKSHLSNCYLANADLSCGSSLVDSTFNNCDFSSTNLKSCNFSKSRFFNCKFDNADLSDVNFDGTSFEGICSFNNAIIKDTFQKISKIESVSLVQYFTNFTSISFKNISFGSGIMEGKTFSGCNFEKCTISNCVGATISQCDFNDCNISDYFQNEETRNIFANCRMANVQFSSYESFKTCSSYKNNYNSISIVDKEYDLLKQNQEYLFDLQKEIPNENSLLYSAKRSKLSLDEFKKIVNEKSTASGFLMVVIGKNGEKSAIQSDSPIGKETNNLKIFKNSYSFNRSGIPNTDSSYFINFKPDFIITKKGNCTCLELSFELESIFVFAVKKILD